LFQSGGDTRDDDDPYAHSDEETEDEAKARTTICLFGKTREGKNVVARVKYPSFFFLEIPDRWNVRDCEYFVRDLSKWLRLKFDDIQYTREQRKRAYGWVPKSMTDGSETATFPMLKLRFPTEKH